AGYIGTPDHIASGLAEAFAAYSAGRGPVMVIAPREVLSASSAPGELPRAAKAAEPRVQAVRSAEVEQLATLLNSAPRRLLCQVGPLRPGAHELLYELARKAGIGLVDTVSQPGTVSRHRDGQIVAEYLGTLSMYGHSARVYDYLFSGGALRPADEQTVMFIGT